MSIFNVTEKDSRERENLGFRSRKEQRLVCNSRDKERERVRVVSQESVLKWILIWRVSVAADVNLELTTKAMVETDRYHDRA